MLSTGGLKLDWRYSEDTVRVYSSIHTQKPGCGSLIILADRVQKMFLTFESGNIFLTPCTCSNINLYVITISKPFKSNFLMNPHDRRLVCPSVGLSLFPKKSGNSNFYYSMHLCSYRSTCLLLYYRIGLTNGSWFLTLFHNQSTSLIPLHFNYLELKFCLLILPAWNLSQFSNWNSG